jgi:hypothetical protein
MTSRIVYLSFGNLKYLVKLYNPVKYEEPVECYFCNYKGTDSKAKGSELTVFI